MPLHLLHQNVTLTPGPLTLNFTASCRHGRIETAEAQPRKLQKSRTDRMLFGVAGGLAEYLDIDAGVTSIQVR